GVYTPTSGSITFNGVSVPGHKPHQITRLGIARTFQNIRLFHSLSVFDNVRTAMQMHLKHGILHALMRGRSFRDEENSIEASVLELLDIFGLKEKRDEEAISM